MAQAQFLPHRRYVARLGILLVLALVFAQTGAVLHAYSHTHASPHRTQTTDSGAPGPAGQVCSDCLSFAPLLTAAGGTAQPPTVARSHAGTTYRFFVAPLAGQPPQHAFRSRAPPSLA